MKPYHLHFLQFLKATDQIDWRNFCVKLQDSMTEEGFLDHIFSDESAFHISGKMHKHNVHIWGTENPHKMLQHERPSPKIIVFFFSQCPHKRFMGLSFFVKTQ